MLGSKRLGANQLCPCFWSDSSSPVCAAAFFGLVIINSMNLDTHQRIGLGVAIVGFAYLVGATVHRLNNAPESITVSKLLYPTPTTVTSPLAQEKEKPKNMPEKPKGSDRSVKIGDGNIIKDSPIITGDVKVVDPGRIITQAAGDAAVSALSTYKNTTFMISAGTGSSEPRKLAEQIMAILVDAEWAPKQRSIVPLSGVNFSGVLIYYSKDCMPAAKALETALRAAGLSATANPGPSDLVKVDVLSKP